MADRDVTDEFIATVMRHRHEDVDAQQLEKRMEALLPRLREGRNYVNHREYYDCVLYFLSQPEIEKAQDAKSFRVLGRMEIIRVRWSDESRLTTVRQLAKLAGVDRSTMHRLLVAAELPFKWRGKEKLYDFNALEQLRDDECA